MNKHIVKYLLALASIALVGGGCHVDDYNEEYLDGFNPNPEITDIQNLRYTMTDADYVSVASNAANKAIAEAAGEDAVAALAAVGTAKCFSEAATAATYLPAFVSQAYNSYLSNGSSVTVTYKNATNLADEVVRLAAAGTYNVTGENYKSVWGDVPANYFTPEKPLDGYAAEFLAAAYPDAEDGTFKIVTYNYSITEPSTGGETVATSIDEGFDAGLGAWQIVKGESTSTWTLDDYNGAKSAKCSAFKTTGPQDLWLISDKVDLSMADSPSLAFDIRISYGNHKGLSVLVSSDYDGIVPEEATWTDITHHFVDDKATSGKWYSAGVCDMSAFKDAPIYIAFRYVGDAAEDKTTTYQIDNIQLGQGVVTVDKTPLLSDTFEDLGKWNLVKAAGEDSYQWAIKTYSGNNYAQVSANRAPGAVESWLVSKDPIAVPAFAENGMTALGFDLKIGYWNADCFSVLVSEDYSGDAATATWTDITTDFIVPQEPTGGYASDFSMAGVSSLYGYAGKSIHIAFKYTGDGANGKTTTYQIDNVEVASMKHRAAAPAALNAMTRAAKTERYAVYTFNGTTWVSASNTSIVNPEDYTQMGASNPNFSSSFSPDTYLPLYLKVKYPYAMPEDVIDVAYHFYASSATELRADRYSFDGTNWNKTLTFETLDGPFKKVNGKWNFDPSMTIVVAPDRSAFSKSYYQACVDYVIDSKDQAYRYDNRNDKYYTDTEYYSGCATSYTNLNWRINTLPVHYWSRAGEDVTPYENFGSEDKALAKASFAAFYAETEKRFGEVMAAALGTLHGDVKMIPGIDVIYTVQMMLYTQHIGSGTGKVTHAFEFKLVDNGKFEYVRMYALSPEYELMRDENFQ